MSVVKIILSAAILSGSVSLAGSASAENLMFGFNNPNFGGNPNNGAFLFGLAEAQRTATADIDDNGGQTPGIGGGSPGGPTIIIPVTPGAPQGPGVNVGDLTEAQTQQVGQ